MVEQLPFVDANADAFVSRRIRIVFFHCAELTVSAIAVHSLESELSYSHRRLGPMVSGTQVDEVKNSNKGEITTIRIYTVSQKESHSVQKLKLVYLPSFTFYFAQHKKNKAPHLTIRSKVE